MILNSYLICLRCTQGSTIKRIVYSRGASLDGKIPFPLMTKGERFIICIRGEIHHMHKTEAWFQREKWSQRCRGQRHVSRGSMSDMTSVLHDIISVFHQSVSINAKGGYC
jgi:hypothetical protein